MPDFATIQENLAEIHSRMAVAAEKAGRRREDVELLVVTKTWPAGVVQLAVDAGQGKFGENRVQEAAAKIPELPVNLEWHLIGPLQKNKIRKALPLFAALHGIDSLGLAQQLNRIAEEEGKFPEIYLEVNVGAEESKAGFRPEVLLAELDDLLILKRLRISGLMCIPPPAADPEDARPFFVQLRELRDRLEKAAGVTFPKLSMGMSHDYPIAIEEGATLVRVGSAVFGERGAQLPS